MLQLAADADGVSVDVRDARRRVRLVLAGSAGWAPAQRAAAYAERAAALQARTPFFLWAAIEELLQTLHLFTVARQDLALAVKDLFMSRACLSLLCKLLCPVVLLHRQAILEHHPN